MADQLPKPSPRRRSCLKCGYSLETLPAVHVCPECGLEYDPHSVRIPLWGGRSNAAQNAIGSVLMIAFFVWTIISEGRSIREFVPCIVPLLLVAIISARRWFGAIETGRHVIMSHKGIQIIHPDLRSRLITWDEFGSAHVSWLTGGFRINNRKGRKILRCRYYQLGSLLAARELTQRMQDLSRIYTRPDWRNTPK